MAGYFAKRLIWAVVLLLVVTLVTYIIFFVIPADAGPHRPGAELDRRSDFREYGESSRHGLPAVRGVPLPARHRGRARELVLLKRSVNSILGSAAPVTLALVLGGAVLWMLLAIPIGIISALRPRSILDRRRDGLRADRDLGASRLDRPDVLVLLRLQARLVPDLRLLRLLQPVDAVRRTDRMGVPHDPALDLVRAALRGVLRPADPLQRDRRDERGVRANCAREGGRRVDDRALPRAAGGACCRSSPCSPSTSAASRSGARLDALHRDGLRPAGTRQGAETRLCSGTICRSSPASSCCVTVCVVLANLVADLVYALLDPRIKLRGCRSDPAQCRATATTPARSASEVERR